MGRRFGTGREGLIYFWECVGDGSKGEAKGANKKNEGKEEDRVMLAVKTGSDPEPDGAGSNEGHELGGEARESTDDDVPEDIVDRYHRLIYQT